MAHILKSFTELGWPIRAHVAIAKRDGSLGLLALSPPETSAGRAIVLEHNLQRGRDFVGRIGEWHHGGINE